MTIIDWVEGDMLGLRIPAHKDSLREGGAEFLTDAFHASGALAPDNRVVRIRLFKEWVAGGTGRKVLLSVEYEKSEPALPTNLFVKFSRSFDDEIRDRQRHHMESEVRFAMLSRMPEFPIAVAQCMFADFHHESGTGILITQRIPFGHDGIERHYHKCTDYEMPDQLAHYQALMRALGRLAGSHKAGRLPETVAKQFPLDLERLLATGIIPYTPQRLGNRIARLIQFVADFPNLLPDNIRSPGFLAKFAEEAPRYQAHEAAISRFLYSQPDFVALCHWNANSDNAWYWRNAEGEIQCGLLDWGSVGQIHMGMVLWGCLSSAETEVWNPHIDDLVALLAGEFHRAGGPELDLDELMLHFRLFVMRQGLSALMDAPPLIKADIPDLRGDETRFDPRFEDKETARVQLHMMTNFLNYWERADLGKALGQALEQLGPEESGKDMPMHDIYLAAESAPEHIAAPTVEE